MLKGWSTFIYAEKQDIDNIALWHPLYHILWVKPFPKSFADLGTSWQNLLHGEVLTSNWCPFLNGGWHRETYPALPSPSPGPQTQTLCCNENDSDAMVYLGQWAVVSSFHMTWCRNPTLASAINVTHTSFLLQSPTCCYRLTNAIPDVCPYGYLPSQTTATTSQLRYCCQPVPYTQHNYAGSSRLNSNPEKYLFLYPPGILVLFELINSWEDVFQNKQ